MEKLERSDLRWFVCGVADYVGFIKKVMKQLQAPQYAPMKKMEVDMRPLDAEEEKAKEGQDCIVRMNIAIMCFELVQLEFVGGRERPRK